MPEPRYTSTSTASSEHALTFVADDKHGSKRGVLTVSILGARGDVTLAHVEPDGLRVTREDCLRLAEFFCRVAAGFRA